MTKTAEAQQLDQWDKQMGWGACAPHRQAGRNQMICFRDQSYCAESAGCANTDCNRKWTDELAYQANRWWGGEGVSFL